MLEKECERSAAGVPVLFVFFIIIIIIIIIIIDVGYGEMNTLPGVPLGTSSIFSFTALMIVPKKKKKYKQKKR